MAVSSLVQPVSCVCGRVNGFRCFIATDSAIAYILMPVYYQIVGGTVWGWIPRSGVAVFRGENICSSVRYCHIPFHKSMALCIPTDDVRDHLSAYNLSSVVWWFHFLQEIVFRFWFFFLNLWMRISFCKFYDHFCIFFNQLRVHVFCPLFCCAFVLILCSMLQLWFPSFSGPLTFCFYCTVN